MFGPEPRTIRALARLRTLLKAGGAVNYSIQQGPLRLAKKISRKTGKSGAKRKAKAGDYQHPIPDRSALLDYLETAGRPVKAEQMLADLGLKGQRMRGL